MENYDELCPKFIANPHINPVNNLPIADEEFDYYREVCKDFGYEFPPGNSLNLMYKNKYYGMRVCRDFLEDSMTNPVTGTKLYTGSQDYNNLLDLCDYYKFDTTVLGERKSTKLKTKRKNYLGQLPSELEQKLESKAESKAESKLLPKSKAELLPIPKSALLPVPRSTQRLGLLPIPKSALSSGRRVGPVSKKSDDILTNLRMIAREIPKDDKVRKVVTDTLSIILQKNADYKGNKFIISGSKNKYGIKQFVFDLLINEEIDLVMRILEFFGLKYIDIAELLFDFPTYANNESLMINYFINAPPETDWTLLDDILQSVYENWIIEDKLKLIILLTTSAIAVGNDFLIEILVEIFNNWRDGIQEEIDEIEDDYEQKDRLIDLVEIIDTLSIR